MSLRSKLFSGDRKLEAAAVSDPGHITPGSTGAHVTKIQAALTLIDDAEIAEDEIRRQLYGKTTSDAVLSYKQKRTIINRSYQTTADNIVGKMTMASLDSEMLTQEAVPRKRVQIKPLDYHRVRPVRPPVLAALIDPPAHVQLNFALGASVLGAPQAAVKGPSIHPAIVLEMRRNSVADIVVSDAEFGEVVVADPSIVTIRQDAMGVPPGPRAIVVANPQVFKVHSGKLLGTTKITASTLHFEDGSAASIDVVVKTFFSAPTFVKGDEHNHKPTGKWSEVQADTKTDFPVNLVCKFFSPQGVVDKAKEQEFNDKPIALRHLDWYLKEKGKDFIEDANIKDWLLRDAGIQKRLKKEIFPPGRKPRGEGHFEFEQDEFVLQDFRYAFGAIDRLDFEVDFSQDTVRVWFKDRYEWHPYYPFYDLQKGDVLRTETNCVHAALVELKSSGAADYWMVGSAEVNLSQIIKP